MSGNEEKSPFGPIIDPSPGPTLDIDVAAPEIDVIKSKPVSDSKAVNRKKITKYNEQFGFRGFYMCFAMCYKVFGKNDTKLWESWWEAL